ncbi:zinc ABC transporter substrate-binding protein [Roseibium sp. SCP14]|uniref:zinc ABC transporter substrate-binding protein n=1 Tax=Roseibium sp. SCP14 TaxID=3141375 RepID=UPI00333A9345
MTVPSRSSSFTRRAHGLAFSTALTGTFVLSLAVTPAIAASPSVVTTIKPLHSIASAVMEGVGTPHILIDGASSPHGFALKPSQAFLLQGADAVFWIGPELAPSLEKPIGSMAGDATTVELMDAAGIQHLAIREGANFDAHDHGDHEDHVSADDHNGHDDHDEHAEKHDDHDHEHDEHTEKHGDHEEHEHADHDDHDHGDEKGDHAEHADGDHSDEHAHEGANDAHFWLNPDNGIAIAHVMADTLSQLDPDNAETYQKNAANFETRIEKLEQSISSKLEPVAGKKFVVFHDAYHHFEHHFDFEASGAITLSPEALSSADRVAEVQNQIKELNVTCVFQEPQFDAKLVNVVLEGSDARKGTLDPLGTELANGADLYPQLIEGLADSLVECLSGQS